MSEFQLHVIVTAWEIYLKNDRYYYQIYESEIGMDCFCWENNIKPNMGFVFTKLQQLFELYPCEEVWTSIHEIMLRILVSSNIFSNED